MMISENKQKQFPRWTILACSCLLMIKKGHHFY